MSEVRVKKSNKFLKRKCFFSLLSFVCFCAPMPLCFADEPAEAMKPMPVKLIPATAQNKSQRLKNLEELLEQENLFEAQEVMKTFSEAEIQQNPRLLVCKASIAKGLYQPEESYAALRRALKLDQNYAPAQFDIALYFMERKEWNDAEVLLRLAAASDLLTGQRRVMLPYYLGVIAFETGRLFEARSSFLRLSWNDSLDPALQQSTGAFVSKIVKQRPGNLLTPLSVQYESNVLGLTRSTPLPADYSRADGLKVIAGLFANLEGLGGEKLGSGPYGLGLRLFAAQNLSSEFSSMNILFAESEANLIRLLDQKWGLFKMALTLNLIRAGNRNLSSSAAVKATLKETEISTAFESDLQKSSQSDRSSILMRAFRDQQLFNSKRVSINLPIDAGLKIAIKSIPGENKVDGNVSPAASYAFSRRMSLKMQEKLGVERLSSSAQSAAFVLKNSPSLSFSFSIEPFLIFSANAAFEWEKNNTTGAVVQKTTTTATLLGIL